MILLLYLIKIIHTTLLNQNSKENNCLICKYYDVYEYKVKA